MGHQVQGDLRSGDNCTQSLDLEIKHFLTTQTQFCFFFTNLLLLRDVTQNALMCCTLISQENTFNTLVECINESESFFAIFFFLTC